ncbi:hypothetical protein D1007_01174 [Hordeum vulgare]|uniref:Uncharacterized protein n=1 Tax=Hordeum vulgare subsp. vulgare TaxID=112509 RepID=M0Z6P5_HORVV|nr:heat shock protein 21, chloroplastic-like [Hordeum vulgare subsp. vulgare]KAE8820858.1 hypothetical protein D1007_01174 [Hordeum vulgare]
MSTVVASYTPASRSPVLPSSSGTPASRSWRPAAAAAFPNSLAVKCRRPSSSSVVRAHPEKQRPAYSIPPTALLYPVQPPDSKERWDIKEEEDYVKLWFQVPGLSEDDLEITAGEDMLEIKRKAGTRAGGRGHDEDVHGVGSFHVKLLMTKEYDSNDVTAELKAGMLEITVAKSKKRSIKQVGFGQKSPPQPAKNPGPAPPQPANNPGPAPAPVVVRTGNISPNSTLTQEKAGPNKAQGDGSPKATPKGA